MSLSVPVRHHPRNLSSLGITSAHVSLGQINDLRVVSEINKGQICFPVIWQRHKAQDPCYKRGVIGLLCKVFSVRTPSRNLLSNFVPYSGTLQKGSAQQCVGSPNKMVKHTTRWDGCWKKFIHQFHFRQRTRFIGNVRCMEHQESICRRPIGSFVENFNTTPVLAIARQLKRMLRCRTICFFSMRVLHALCVALHTALSCVVVLHTQVLCPVALMCAASRLWGGSPGPRYVHNDFAFGISFADLMYLIRVGRWIFILWRVRQPRRLPNLAAHSRVCTSCSCSTRSPSHRPYLKTRCDNVAAPRGTTHGRDATAATRRLKRGWRCDVCQRRAQLDAADTSAPLEPPSSQTRRREGR